MLFIVYFVTVSRKKCNHEKTLLLELYHLTPSLNKFILTNFNKLVFIYFLPNLDFIQLPY